VHPSTPASSAKMCDLHLGSTTAASGTGILSQGVK